MFLRSVLLCAVLTVFSPGALARVRLFQLTDGHSPLRTIISQMRRIHQMAEEFKQENPEGEVVIYIIGDFTAINPDVDDKGWLSLEAIRLLKRQGYTVLFTPGNHDAFDWIEEPDDIQLFIDQMKQMKDWGVKILAENLTGRTPLLDSLLSPSYHLKTVEPETHIVGLTHEGLINHSNLYEEAAQVLFTDIESYSQTLTRILPKMRRQGVKTVMLGIHDGYKNVSNFAKGQNLIKDSEIETPLMMAAHDHLVASDKVGETLISDAGSLGSFTAIDISNTGKVLRIRHVSVFSEARRYVNGKDMFHYGTTEYNPVTEGNIEENSWLKEYDQKIRKAMNDQNDVLQKVNGFYIGDRVVVTLENDIPEMKIHMQHGRIPLGDMIAEALAQWARSVLPEAEGRPAIAMFNSSAYRLEEPIPKGPITESILRKMYPYQKKMAHLYKFPGDDIERRYFSLRRDYALRSGNTNRHSPQINPEVREFEGRLQVRGFFETDKTDWTNIDKNESYPNPIGPWLSQHSEGQSYKIKEWLEALEGREPLASESFQEILVKFLPPILKAYDREVSQLKATLNPDLCGGLFEPSQLLLQRK